MKLCSVLLLSIAACVSPADEPETQLGTQQLAGQCPSWKCGENSPLIDNYGLHEQNLDHLPDSGGFALDSVTKGATPYTMLVSNATITAKDANGGSLSGTALVGLTLHLKHNGATTYDVRITDVQPAWFWAKAPQGTYPQFEAYRLQWFDNLGKWQDVCPLTPNPDDTLGMNGHLSTVFEGDRIDAKAKTDYATDARWFNIGCAGSTLAKMQLTGHTWAAGSYGYKTSITERQTMLKMLSADYCGTGTPFTVAGMPLYWADDQGTMKVVGKANLEARWNPHGAACLMKPRVDVNPTQLAKDTFPDIYAAIRAECKLPPNCNDQTLNVGPEHLLSANPVLP